MSDENKMGYGYVDDTDDSLRSKSGVSFGLNQGSFVTKFEYNAEAGKDGSAGNAIDLTITTGDKEQMLRIFEVTKVFGKDGEITDKTSEEYVKAFNAAQVQNNAMITHVVKAFRTEEDIKNALSTPPTNFVDYAKVMTGLMPSGYDKIPVDVFYEYQWEIKGDNDRTYLQIPRNMKGGYWICKAQEGSFKAVNDEKGLKYVNEGGQEHPFTRSKDYMESPKANQQVEGQDDSAITQEGGAPTKSTW